jgi:hypothetical protein
LVLMILESRVDPLELELVMRKIDHSS